MSNTKIMKHYAYSISMIMLRGRILDNVSYDTVKSTP